jgi:rhodanese-related sulfurtransferase
MSNMPDLFQQRGIIHQGVLSLSPREANELAGSGLVIIDLRNPDYTAYKAFDAVNVLSLPMEQFDEGKAALEPDMHYVLADASGIHSHRYAKKLQGMGFKHVASLSGGFVEWERDGMPVRVDVRERLSGACACQLRPREQS